jgi:hypothetical protein
MVDIVQDYRNDIKECYFAMPGDPSGRAPLGVSHGELDVDAYHVFWMEMRRIVDLGVEPVLLLNAACYGKEAISASFQTYFFVLFLQLRPELGFVSVTTMF